MDSDPYGQQAGGHRRKKMPLFVLENDVVEYVQLLSTQKANSLRIASHLWIPLFSTELFWQLKNSSLWMAVGRY